MLAYQAVYIFEDDYSAEESWRLLSWCMSKGANEFSVRCVGDDHPRELRWAAFQSRFSAFSRGRKSRRIVNVYEGEDVVQSIHLWQLNSESLQLLHQELEDGLFTYGASDPAWLEDPVIYRDGSPMLGIVTHEWEGILRASPDEIRELEELGYPFRLQGKSIQYRD